jgi:arylsulfatase A-like enzyme
MFRRRFASSPGPARLFRPLLTAFVAVAAFAALRAATPPPAPSAPDVLFLAADDLNDWITLLDPAAPIATPNLERLARRGVSFTRAYAASPACNASRTALLTGRAPASTGVYGNAADWRRALPDAVTLPGAFMRAGYRVDGAGKIFHHHLGGAFHDAASFHEFLPLPDPPDAPMPGEKLNRLPGYGSANTDWGAWPAAEAEAPDVRSVDWCIARLRQPRPAPLFLACGLFRPHMPFFVPARWLERYPADRVRLPELRADDLADIPPGGRALHAPEAGRFWAGMRTAEQLRPGSWRDAVRHYQAAATFADAQIGRLLDALDATPRGRATIVVFWSDHGYQLGEKDAWEKFTLWEKATRVPFVVVAPGLAPAGATCARPVTLLDLYPTLVELAGLPAPAGLEGRSLLPLLRDPTAAWDRPAVMTYRRGNHAVRSERYRYIRYANGDEELYDHAVDPHEWTNLAGRADSTAVKADLARWLPRTDAPDVADLRRPGKKN